MHPATRLALAAFVASALSARAHAQVQVFEEVPSLEQLRTILVPASHAPSMARKIVLPPRPAPGQEADQAPVMQAANTEAAVAADAPAAGARKEAAPEKHPAPKHAPPANGVARAVALRITFALNSVAIPERFFPHLDRIAELLREEPKLALAVEGHTDAQGGDVYNLELSRRRAEAVAHYLTAHGVERQRVTAIGKGKAEPLTADPYDPRNRRVQFVALDAGNNS